MIRPARPADAAAIAKVHVETWRSSYAGILPDSYLVGLTEERRALHWARLLERIPAGQGVLAAEAPDGRLVGFGSWAPGRSQPPIASGEVQTLYLLPDWQGQGLGRALLRGLLAALAAAGHEAAYLWVLADNPTRFFYERLGGRRVAEQREPFAGVELLEYAYRWDGLGG